MAKMTRILVDFAMLNPPYIFMGKIITERIRQ